MAPYTSRPGLRTKPKIPVQIPAQITTTISSQANGLISAMPAIVHATIFEYLDDPADMTALSLTCKTHANMYHELGAAGLIKTKPLVRSKFREGPRLEFMRRLISWEPMKLFRLCTTCQHFLPKTDSGWGGDSTWHTTKENSKKLTLKGAKVWGSRCRHCVKQAETEVAIIRKQAARARTTKKKA